MHTQKTEVEILHSAYQQLWQQMYVSTLFQRLLRTRQVPMSRVVKVSSKHIATSL